MAYRGSNFERSVPVLAKITRAPVFLHMDQYKQAVVIADDTIYKVVEWVEPSQVKFVERLIKRLRQSGRYLTTLANGGKKYNLNNQPVGDITIGDKQYARRILAGRAKYRLEREMRKYPCSQS
jgi:hypothetical protein